MANRVPYTPVIIFFDKKKSATIRPIEVLEDNISLSIPATSAKAQEMETRVKKAITDEINIDDLTLLKKLYTATAYYYSNRYERG